MSSGFSPARGRWNFILALFSSLATVPRATGVEIQSRLLLLSPRSCAVHGCNLGELFRSRGVNVAYGGGTFDNKSQRLNEKRLAGAQFFLS